MIIKMSNSRIFLYVFSVMAIMTYPAIAKDYVNPLDYKISVYRNGENLPVEQKDKFFVKLRISTLFKSYKADTSEPWFKYEKEKHDISLADMWNTIKAGSYFSLTYNEEKKGAIPASDTFRPTEVIVEIQETPDDGFFGEVMARSELTQEIRAYQVNTKDQVSLYCFEKTIPYLPEHYTNLVEKYDTGAYSDSGISCNLYTDSVLKEIKDKKQAKEDKWRKLREKKYGIKPKKTEEE